MEWQPVESGKGEGEAWKAERGKEAVAAVTTDGKRCLVLHRNTDRRDRW